MSERLEVARRQHAPRLAEAKSADDDWTGRGDANARRKRQNRLNVRAYRKRKTEATAGASAPVGSTTLQPYWFQRPQNIAFLASTTPRDPRAPLLPMDDLAAHSIKTVVLPLSSDHLITLVQFNVLRGSLTNRHLLDQIDCLNSNLHERFASRDMHTFPNLSACELSLLPPSLHPTLLQRTTSYPHWIDIAPHPAMRDNLIKNLGTFDAHQLWLEIIGGLFEGFSGDEMESKGLVMWDTPWTWEGWELSEGFVKKWSWMLEGCEDMVRATNRWRERRGEEALVLEL